MATPQKHKTPDKKDDFVKVSFEEFLQTIPPNQSVEITNPRFNHSAQSGLVNGSTLPTIRLWCPSTTCSGERFFDPAEGKVALSLAAEKSEILHYYCKNCNRENRVFALGLFLEGSRLIAVKYGEHPAFGPHLPSRLRTLVGPDQDRFSKGLRCESLGFGIGAFSYYRQVVEDQKDRLIGQISDVAQTLDASPEVLADLEEARKETQFATAIEKIKHGLPEILMMDGNNPLSLLHKALSEGLHNGTDPECLNLAQSIRIVLAELADRISIALKNEKTLKDAVSNILNRPPKKQGPETPV
jgi:hypothetical protein